MSRAVRTGAMVVLDGSDWDWLAGPQYMQNSGAAARHSCGNEFALRWSYAALAASRQGEAASSMLLQPVQTQVFPADLVPKSCHGVTFGSWI